MKNLKIKLSNIYNLNNQNKRKTNLKDQNKTKKELFIAL